MSMSQKMAGKKYFIHSQVRLGNRCQIYIIILNPVSSMQKAIDKLSTGMINRVKNHLQDITDGSNMVLQVEKCRKCHLCISH